MKVVMQTRITPVMTVYDSETPESGPSGNSSSVQSLLDLLKPVIQLQDDQGQPILKTGEFYPSLFPLIVLFAVLVVGYLIFRRS